MNRSLTLLVSCAMALPISASDRSLHLSLGDPEHREREASLLLDTVTDTRSGPLASPAALAPLLTGAKVLLVGESHMEDEFHRVQLRVLQELVAAGRKVTVGLEMFPAEVQPVLDRWSSGELDEEGFLEASEWYESWGYPFAYYRDIFLLARKHRLRMVGLNVPREVISAVRTKGLDGLDDNERQRLPVIDLDSSEHRQLFEAFFDEDDPIHAALDESAWSAMFRAQCAWDGVMAEQIVAALPESDDQGDIVVVLVGSGHVAYHLGIARQARAQGFSGTIRSLLPVAVEDDEGARRESVRATYADFLWGLPRERWPRYPSLGIATVKDEESGRRRVMWVDEESPAARAGFAVGDLLLAMDGAELASRADLNRRLAALAWGDVATFSVSREGSEEPVRLRAELRRQLPDPAP